MPDGNNDYAKEFKFINLNHLANYELAPSTGMIDDVEQLKREVEVLWQCIKVLAREVEKC